MGCWTERHCLVVWRWVVAAVAGALAATACGNTETSSDQQPMAGTSNGARAGAGGSGEPVALGGGGSSASAGTGQTGGTAGSTPSSGGAPPRFPLIVGDAACPPAAPESLACQQPGATCVYRGIASGLSSTFDPVRCACDGDLWACVGSNEKGETSCPLVPLPGPADPCPASGGVCVYVQPVALAHCYCSQDTERGGAGGAAGAGAGGAETGPSSLWLCGL